MEFETGLRRRMGLASTAVGALLCAVLPLAEPAEAGDMWNSVTNFFSAPFGGGKSTGPSDDGAIDYRPRPALVVPPAYTLPPPQTHVARSADWPKDPDATALRRARVDSRRPAPSADSLPADAPHPAVFVREPGPNCNSVLGMPMCFKSPWGQEVELPGAVKSDKPRGILLTTNQTRKYLVDPPVDYLVAVPLADKGEKEQFKRHDKVQEDSQITRAPPAVDETPPGK